MSNIRRQELHCHACQGYVQFDVDMDANGNHVLECPNCKHEHCRVVKDGEITSERWDQRNGDAGQNYTVSTTATYTYQSTFATTGTSSTTTGSTGSFMYQSWMTSAGTA